MSYELVNNKAENKYQIKVDGHIAYVEYDIKGNEIHLTHTIVPKELGGRGIATEMVRLVLEDVEKLGLEVVPVCSFVEKYLEKHSK